MNLNDRINGILALFAVAATLVAFPAFGVEVDGIQLEDSVRIANDDLKLNGAGTHYKVFFKVYAAALYLPDKKTTASEVLALPGAKRLTMVMLRDVSSETFAQSFMTGLKRNTSFEDRTKIINQLLTFGQMFATIPEVKKGDVLTFDWIPGAGTLFRINGKKVSELIPDVTFYNAFLRIWLGQKPADEKLKRLMLGEKTEERGRVNF
ncbi:chalcone isomerase family protein [Noviherbaspirillum sp.]|uniref:chalcone isomerase family protein n=1 Tax=Noviherbaspirillum sp. TaxID=1926288 RepID=UPI002B471689|nr:chalcone isomerase family protein [Noviherbaspirillum sp.]HJV80560.1 chalcone isomerase family protein [Noviherbaspirillum sp.]